jgi:hypothetical protein
MRDGYLRGALSPQATRRQTDVLAAYVAAGGSVTDAAELVGVRPITVRSHLAGLRARSGLTTAQLVYPGGPPDGSSSQAWSPRGAEWAPSEPLRQDALLGERHTAPLSRKRSSARASANPTRRSANQPIRTSWRWSKAGT